MESIWQITGALASLSDHDLDGLAAGISAAPLPLEGLAVWIQHAVDWERDRRQDRHYALRNPTTVIKPDEVALALVALAVLSEGFRDNADVDSATVASFLESVAAVIRDPGRTDTVS